MELADLSHLVLFVELPDGEQLSRVLAVQLEVVADDVVEVAEGPWQEEFGPPGEKLECLHRRGGVVEVEAHEADQWPPTTRIFVHGAADVAEEYLRTLELLLDDGKIDLEEAFLPDVRHVAVVDRIRHPGARVEPDDVDADSNLPFDLAGDVLEVAEPVAGEDAELDRGD